MPIIVTTEETFIAERIEATGYAIGIYCRKRHGCDELCDDCSELRDYAFERIRSCKNNSTGIRCVGCPARCFRSDMRDRMSEVKAFSGPRMILHPKMLRRL